MNQEPHADARGAMIRQIESEFASVSRGTGVSWSETVVLDLYGTEDEQRKARLKDRDRHWRELVDDESWRPDAGVGAWSFLDAESFPYYLPAGMIRCLRTGLDEGLAFPLTLVYEDYHALGIVGISSEEEGRREWKLAKWSKLTLPQRRCVAAFLRLMTAIDEGSSNDWNKALRQHWAQFD